MTIKRIMKDIIALTKHPLTSHGIHTINDEDTLGKVYVLMIGPEDTPYEDGFFFFQIDLPDTYPIDPPKVKYLTQGGKIRFNPNLYVSGKVCLSIINTWMGPGWSPCNTLSSVLISIQAMVLIDNPLTNEPGFENASKSKLKDYSEIIRHESLRTGLLGMIKQLPLTEFKPFIPIMENHIYKNASKIKKRIDNLAILHDGKSYSSTYGLTLTPFYAKLKNEFIELNNKITNNRIKETTKLATKLTTKLTVTIPNVKLLTPDIIPLVQVIPYMTPKVTMKDSLSKMKEIAKNLEIDIKKKSTKSGKMINKSKSELLLEIYQKQT
jgi:ubiquitin-protein ligase